MASTSGKIAQQTFELNNNVQDVPASDGIYAYDNEEQRRIQQARPWKADPHHFKHVRISAVALVKMVTHARSGGQYEIMGLMQGKIENETFVVMDAFALPVLGTETRVNAGAEGDEYSVQYQTISKDVSIQSAASELSMVLESKAILLYFHLLSPSPRDTTMAVYLQPKCGDATTWRLCLWMLFNQPTLDHYINALCQIHRIELTLSRYRRSDDRETLSAGITPIQAMDAGSPESTSLPSSTIRSLILS